MAKTHQSTVVNKEAPYVAVVASTLTSQSDSPVAVASPILYGYSFPTALSSSAEDASAECIDAYEGRAEAVPVVTAACCFPDDTSFTCDLIAQNVDLFDLNVTVQLGVADQIDRQHPGAAHDAVHCFYIPQECAPVEADLPALDLTEEEAALLMDLMDKSMITAPDALCAKAQGDRALSKELYSGGSAELDNIVLDMYYEEDEREQLNYQLEMSTGCVYPPAVTAVSEARHSAAREAVDRSKVALKKRKRDPSPKKAPMRTAKQIATAKRARTNGQFAKCKIKWVPACALSNNAYGGTS